MIKTVADPLVNACVKRSSTVLPVLKIPTAEPLISDANDWEARFTTVKATFSSRVGQISNAALSRGVIAYDESITDEERKAVLEEVETLAILTGLEIDSAKSGIKIYQLTLKQGILKEAASLNTRIFMTKVILLNGMSLQKRRSWQNTLVALIGTVLHQTLKSYRIMPTVWLCKQKKQPTSLQKTVSFLPLLQSLSGKKVLTVPLLKRLRL